MTHALSSLQPTTFWDNFYQLTQIPRPSKHEEAIQAFMLDFGQSLELETFRDEVGNIIIKKPATPGYENCKGVVLQSHLDMVPQANNETSHDFKRDPINAYVDGEWVTAQGTTLGADNGIGVAAIMTVLADPTLEHGPLEALLTCDEETGMTGALNLKSGLLQGDILLNLDSEEEKELCIGCAGGVDGVFTLPIERQATTQSKTQAYTISLKGLRGGHSGVNVIQQRANANKLLARFLVDLSHSVHYEMIGFNGGNLRNAIPREARAVILADADKLAEIKAKQEQFKQICDSEFLGVDSFITLDISATDTPAMQPLTPDAQARFLHTINASPNGVYRMSVTIEGLVETSCNVAIVTLSEHHVKAEYLLRSSVDSARNDLAEQITSLFELAGGSSEFANAYDGWEPNTNSEIFKVMSKTGEALFGEKPKTFSIHAGLECGILANAYPHWDMISFGPTIHAMHSPDEKVNIDSVTAFYEWLIITLKVIPKKT